MSKHSITTRLGVRYALVIGILAVLACSSYWLLQRQISFNKASGEIINISGRQRMLSQRTALLARMYATSEHPSEQQHVRLQLEAATREMQSIFARLTDRAEKTPAQLQLIASYYTGEESVAALLQAYLSNLNTLLESTSDAQATETELVNEILRTAEQGQLLRALDRIVSQYQASNDRNIQRLITIHRLTLLLTLAMLAYAYFGVFRPLHRRLNEDFNALIALRANLERRVRDATQQLRKLASAVEASAESIIITGTNAEIEFANRACQTLNGYTQEELIGRNARIFHSGEHPHIYYKAIWDTIHDGGVWTGEVINQRKDDSTYHARLTIAPIFSSGNEIEGFVGIQSDISREKEHEKQLEAVNRELDRLATTDCLTDIANRRIFDEHLDLEWRRALRAEQPLSLIMADVDFFKAYNDEFGHQQGDQCLQQIARAIANAANRPGDLAARYGGEEFAVLLPGTGVTGALGIAEQIRHNVESLQIKAAAASKRSVVGISLGVAGYIPDTGNAPTSLVEAADQALYRAKEAGKNRVSQ